MTKIVLYAAVIATLCACASREEHQLENTISSAEMRNDPIEYARRRASGGNYQVIQVQSFAPSVPSVSPDDWWIVEKYGTLRLEKTGDWGGERIEAVSAKEFAGRFNSEMVKILRQRYSGHK